MEAPEEEDTGPSGLGAFFGRSTRAPGGGGNGGGPQYDFDGARRRRQAEELAEQGIFVGEFAGRAQAAQQDTPMAVPLHHRTAHSEPQPPAATLPPFLPLPPSPTPTSYAIPPLPTAAAVAPDVLAPDFSVDGQLAERRRMEELLPRDLRDSL